MPEVVGTAIRGLSLLLRAPNPTKFIRLSEFSETRIFTPLAVSSTEPPPTAMIESHPAALYFAAISLTVFTSESAGTSSYNPPAFTFAPRAFFTGSISPAPLTPLSVIIIGFTDLTDASISGSLSRALCPETVLTLLQNS